MLYTIAYLGNVVGGQPIKYLNVELSALKATTRAMVLTGLDIDEMGKPRKWRVENSWGEQGGDKGFMAMTDPWFDEYLYEVAVEKKYLPKELLSLLETPLVPLDPWDPMGSLACSV